MTNQEIYEALRQAGLERLAGQIAPMAKKCVRLETVPTDEKDISVGASKIGGLPDLPPTIKWPQWKNTPLAFLCQIKLEEIVEYPYCDQLPATGWLYFFYDAQQQTWGFSPEDIGSFKVIYYDGPIETLFRRDFPVDSLDVTEDEEKHRIYEPCRISFYEAVSLPEWNSKELDKIFNDDELDLYVDFIEDFSQNYLCATQHQIFGHSNPIQGEMRLECQLVTNGLYCGDASGYGDPRRKTLELGAEDWQLLFQLDTDDNSEMMWGDCGRLYFWIRRQDLLEKDFDKAWMILQCG